MKSRDSEDTGTVSAFFTGALLGAGIALLLAPQSGSKMRGLLREYATRAKDGLDDVLEQGSEAYGTAVKHGQKYVEKGKDSLREAGREVERYTEAGKKAAIETKDDLASKHR